MRMAIVKPRAKHLARAVYRSVEAARGHLLAYFIYFFAVDGEKGVFKRSAVGKKYVCIFEKNFHFQPPYSL
jgi:hypothetical protein